MKIGISSFTFPWAVGVARHPSLSFTRLGPLDLVLRAAELKVDVLQISHNLPLDRLSDNQLAALRNAATKARITIEIGTRGTEPPHLRRYLNIARSLNAKFLRTLTHTTESFPTLCEVRSHLHEVLPEFAREGISIGIENYENHTSHELARFVESIGSEYLGVCLDTVNSLGALEIPKEVVRVLAPYAVNLHIKDFDIRRTDTMMGFSVIGRPAGEGRLDVNGILQRLKRYERNLNIILEQWPPFSDSIDKTVALEAEWAERGIRYIRDCQARLSNRT